MKYNVIKRLKHYLKKKTDYTWLRSKRDKTFSCVCFRSWWFLIVARVNEITFLVCKTWHQNKSLKCKMVPSSCRCLSHESFHRRSLVLPELILM